MTRQVVLLRGVNVGSAHRIAMADLRAVLTGLGGRGVTTYLQSGNAVVDSDLPDLAVRTEQALRDELGLDVRVLVRSADELEAVVAANPFPDRVGTPKQLHVMFLDGSVDEAALAAVGTVHGADRLTPGDRVLYLSYAGGSHDSPLTGALKRLGPVMTGRNWSTVLALQELARRPS